MNKVVVYVLRSETGQLYVGLTNDVLRRQAEHARRQSPSTRRLQGELDESLPLVCEELRRLTNDEAGQVWGGSMRTAKEY